MPPGRAGHRGGEALSFGRQLLGVEGVGFYSLMSLRRFAPLLSLNHSCLHTSTLPREARAHAHPRKHLYILYSHTHTHTRTQSKILFPDCAVLTVRPPCTDVTLLCLWWSSLGQSTRGEKKQNRDHLRQAFGGFCCALQISHFLLKLQCPIYFLTQPLSR